MLSKNLQDQFYKNIKIGIITTAYANGALMKYIEENLKGLNLDLAKTGVKYLHSKARNYDIAVYFEANGHGTIYCNEKLIDKFTLLSSLIENSKDSQILELIQKYISMFNPSIGDALSSLIATESALKVLDFSIEDVYLMYKELPSLNTKISVKDKSIFKCNDNETKLIQPENLQISIDQLVSKFNQARAFIRPSGTEDVVRIYTEAENIDDAKLITQKLVEELKQY
jgi:phosphoacetylglucosamine mutase